MFERLGEILDATTLTAKIPDFEWNGGHSGLVLNQQQAETLDALWNEYLDANKSEIVRLAHKHIDGDLAYMLNEE